MTDAQTHTKDLSLTVTRHIDAAPEALFDAWLDPAMLMKIMRPGPNTLCSSAKTDPVEGGRFEIVMGGDGKVLPHAGTYVTIDRPRKLVFTWESPFSIEGSTVTLTFDPAENGTFVTLNHVRFPTEESRGNHEAGWTAILGILEGAI